MSDQSPAANQKSSTGRSIFEDPAIGDAARNDAFVRFVLKNWRSLLLLLVAIGASMIAYNRFTVTAADKRARATTVLSDIQSAYKGILDKQEELLKLESDRDLAKDDEAKKTAATSIEAKSKEIEESRSKLSLMIDSLSSPAPFDTYSKLYRGLLASRFKDFGLVEQSLQSISPWEAVSDPRSSERFIAETATLGLAKALAQSDDHLVVAKEKLVALGERGEFVAVDALAALALLLNTTEEKDAFKRSLDAARAKFPAQARNIDTISQEL
jgi:hypothetical protein